MRREHDEGRDAPASRRRFLQGAMGLAAASVGSMAARPAASTSTVARGTGVGPLVERDPGCCGPERTLPLYAAALLGGEYVGFADGKAGLGLYRLVVDHVQRVSIGPPLEVDLPGDFGFGSIGVSRGRLVVGGGLPFVFESFDVDDEMDESVRAQLHPLPPGEPTSGMRRVEVEGLRPVAFLVDAPRAEPLALPAMPRRLAAAVEGIAETDLGTLVFLIGHTDGLRVSRYTAAVDIVRLRGDEWAAQTLARGLGESGPHYVATDGEQVVVAINSSSGAALFRPDALADAKRQALPDEGRILGLLPGIDGPVALFGSASGGARAWTVVAGAWSEKGPTRLPGDEIVRALAVAGAKGESIVFGRNSAVLVDDTAALVGA